MSAEGRDLADPAHAPADIPWLDVERMIEVDRAMVEDYGIDLV